MHNAASKGDKWIPWYFVIFFGVVIALDTTFATIAVRTQTGVVTDHPYERGVDYNNVVNAANAQEALGWKGTISYENKTLHFTLVDKKGIPVIAEKAKADFYRPAMSGMDFSTTLYSTAAGIFEISPSFPAQGLWEVRVYADLKGTSFQQSKRIVVE